MEICSRRHPFPQVDVLGVSRHTNDFNPTFATPFPQPEVFANRVVVAKEAASHGLVDQRHRV